MYPKCPLLGTIRARQKLKALKKVLVQLHKPRLQRGSDLDDLQQSDLEAAAAPGLRIPKPLF